MLQQILHILIISFITILWGIPGLLLFKKKNPGYTNNFWIRSTLSFYCFLYFSGLILLSFITSVLCLFIALKFIYLLFLSFGLVLCLLSQKKKIRLIFCDYPIKLNVSLTEVIFIVVCIATFILLGTLSPVNADTKIYHIQIIKWFNEYGTVPGIANLYPRYGLGSNWFNLISIFKMPFFSNNNYTWLNATTVIWFFLWLINNWRYHTNKANTSLSNKILAHLNLFIILFFLYEWELFRDAANSTNYDFIVTAITIVIILYLIEEILCPPIIKSFSLILAVLCISLITFKLSGGLVLILLVYYLFSFKKLSYWIITFITGIVITSPFLIKNYIITGYLLFPIPISVFAPEWQLPLAMTDYLRQFIHVTNRYYNHSIDYTHIPELLHGKWIFAWFSGILLQHKIIILGTFSSFFLFIFNPTVPINIKKLRLLFFLLFLMAMGWFFSAPSPRFGYGVLLILAFFPACFYFGKYISTAVYKPVLYVLIFINGFYIIKKSPPILNNVTHFLYTIPPESPDFNIVDLHGVNIYIPKSSGSGWFRDCIDTRLPCTCQENIFLYPLGNTIYDGFKMIGNPDSTFVRNYVY